MKKEAWILDSDIGNSFIGKNTSLKITLTTKPGVLQLASTSLSQNYYTCSTQSSLRLTMRITASGQRQMDKLHDIYLQYNKNATKNVTETKIKAKVCSI